MNMTNHPSIVERYSVFFIFIFALGTCVLGVFTLEGMARYFGLGQVVVYQSSPIVGYRPGPNQSVVRKNAGVHLNNLGLRATEDWSAASMAPRVLFLGDSITYGGSYIDNTELFSTLSAEALGGIAVGNAGVNGWGVLNVTALVEDLEFTPANIYVSTFPEEDFNRGFNRIGGSPFWTAKPKWALSELFHYFLYQLEIVKFSGQEYPISAQERSRVKQIAVKRLAQMDAYLKAKGAQHLIYITPTKAQALGEADKDLELLQLLKTAGVQVKYLQDSLDFKEPIEHYYHDSAHLSVAGHALWATVYANDLIAILSE